MSEEEEEKKKKIIAFQEWKRKNIFRHGQRGYYSLADLPQRASLASECFGTGWPSFDRLFKFYHGQFVVVTGVAGHGKSTFLFNVICNLARQLGKKFFLYVPENEQYLRETLGRIWNDDATFGQLLERCFVQSSISDDYLDTPLTLDWILDKAIVPIQQDGIEIVLLDPWNEIERAIPKGMMMTDYIGRCLMVIKQFCRVYNVTLIMVAHPTKAVNENGGRITNLGDIEGSMNWYNKCDNGLIVVRDAESNTARVISAKVRERGAGKTGACNFYVDPDTGIFTPQETANYGDHRG